MIRARIALFFFKEQRGKYLEGDEQKGLQSIHQLCTKRILEYGRKLEVGRCSILWEGFDGRDYWEKSGKTGKSTKHQERGLELWLPNSQHPTDSRLLVFLTWCSPFPQGAGLISVTNKIYEYYYMWCLRLGTKKLVSTLPLNHSLPVKPDTVSRALCRGPCGKGAMPSSQAYTHLQPHRQASWEAESHPGSLQMASALADILTAVS